MKKMLCMILAAMLLISVALPVLAAEDDLPTWIYGGPSNKNRAKLKTMGQQSWYLMYSLEIDKAEKINLDSFKECIQNETGLWRPAEEALVPATAPGHEEGEMATFTGSWFSIRKDGLLAPDTGYSAALKWVAEQDGVYDLAAAYSGGTSAGYAEEGYIDPNGGHWVDASDGVYMSMWIRKQGAEAPEMLFIEDTWAAEYHVLPQTDRAFNGVELKAGDEIWLVCDSRLNGGWDSPWWCVSFVRVDDLAAE